VSRATNGAASPCGALLLLCVCPALVVVTGCIPVHLVEPASPPLYGRFRRADGIPARGARVAVTSDYKDPTCAHASQRAVVDSNGIFRISPTKVVRRWMVVIPPVEHFGNSYQLCAGMADSLVHLAYNGYVLLHDTSAVARDSLMCQEWIWQGRSHVTCGGPTDRALQHGGSWSDGTASGFYRIIVVEETAKAFLQWVQRDSPGPAETVREMIELRLAPRLIDVKLWSWPTGAACVRIRSSGPPAHWYTFWNDVRVNVALALGPPGVVHEVPSCGPSS